MSTPPTLLMEYGTLYLFLPEEIHPGYATATTVLVTGAAWAYAFFRHTTVR